MKTARRDAGRLPERPRERKLHQEHGQGIALTQAAHPADPVREAARRLKRARLAQIDGVAAFLLEIRGVPVDEDAGLAIAVAKLDEPFVCLWGMALDSFLNSFQHTVTILDGIPVHQESQVDMFVPFRCFLFRCPDMVHINFVLASVSIQATFYCFKDSWHFFSKVNWASDRCAYVQTYNKNS